MATATGTIGYRYTVSDEALGKNLPQRIGSALGSRAFAGSGSRSTCSGSCSGWRRSCGSCGSRPHDSRSCRARSRCAAEVGQSPTGEAPGSPGRLSAFPPPTGRDQPSGASCHKRRNSPPARCASALGFGRSFNSRLSALPDLTPTDQWVGRPSSNRMIAGIVETR